MGEIVFVSGIVSCVLVLLWSCRVLYGIWWKPMKLEKFLRDQGINGPSYRLLFGNRKEEVRMTRAALSKPMNFSHDVVPRVIPFIHQTVKNYGKMSFTWMGTLPRVHIMDPKLVKEVLTNKNGVFDKPEGTPLIKLIATGLITYDGEKWIKHRRIVNPAFHFEKLKNMLPAFSSSVSNLVNKWSELVAPEGSYELNVWPELRDLTGDVISRAAFGSNFEEGRRIFQLLSEQAKHVIEASRSLYLPGFRYLPTKRNKRMKEIDNEVKDLLRGMINKREKAMKLGEAPTGDLLGLLLESNHRETQESGNSKNAAMSIEDVIEECKLFYLAGQDSTSTLLVWTMITLSMHQEWQDRARAEVLQLFGKEKPDFDGLNRLKIVPMVLNEVLRLYPPAIMVNRVTSKETKLGDITFPGGVVLALLIILVHHDRDVWGDDAQEFNPGRFSEGIAKATNNQVAFFPFSWGPRYCVGQNFAMAEAKMAVSMMLQNFSFELSPTYAHAPYRILALQPQFGAQIILRKL